MGVNCPHCSEEVNGWVPEDRFKQINDRFKAAVAAETEAKAEAAKFQKRAAMADNLNDTITQLRDDLAGSKAESGRTLAMADAGVTKAEDRDYVLWQYGKHGDGADFGDFLASKQKDPTGYYASIWPADGATGDPKASSTSTTVVQAAKPPPPRTNGGAKPTPPSNGQVTAAQITAMSPEELTKHMGWKPSVPLLKR